MNTQKVFKTKFLLILLVGIMALSVIPMAVFAEDNYEARIGSTSFSTLAEAFTYAQNQGGNAKIELLTDVLVAETGFNYKDYGITLTRGNITLDLSGHKVEGKNSANKVSDNSSVFFVSGDSVLTITDSVGGGCIEKNYNNVPVITVGDRAALIVQGGKINGVKGAGILVKGSGSLTVTGNPEIHGDWSNAVLIESGSAQLSGGTYTTNEPDLHSIWNSGGPAADLLAEGYRYGDGNGNAAAFSTDDGTHGVKMEKGGKTVVEPLPPSGVPYIDADGELVYRADYEEIDYTHANIRGNGWYVLTESMTKNYAFSVFGSANLIICDGATLTLDTLKGSTFEGDSSLALNIYMQGGGTGKLVVKNGLVKGSGESKTVTINLISPGMKMVDKDGNKTDGVGKYFEISRCTEHVWEYTNQTDTTHDRVCTLCGTTETGIEHTLASYQSSGSLYYHYIVCECGKAYDQGKHVFEKCIPNPDGLTCTSVCSTCKYELEPKDHEFMDVTTTDGDNLTVCRYCYAELAAEYNGKQYASIQAAINALANMSDSEKYGTAKTGTVTIVAPEHVNENVVVNDPDMVLTIDLGGKEWRADISGTGTYIPLTVEKGWVILKNGKLWQGSSGSSAYAGIVMTGGSLRLDGSVSVCGGRWDTNVLRPSIDIQDGRLELTAGVTLLSGIKVPEDSTLNDYLPKGTAFVKCQMDYENRSVIIPEPYEYITDIYDANESTAGIAIVAHDHVADEHGKCTQCAKQAYFAILTKADGTTENVSSFVDGWAAAIANKDSTLKLLCDVDLGSGDTALEADSGSFTLDLAGFSLKCYSISALINVSGTADITIKNGKLINTVYGIPGDGQLYQNNANAIMMHGGKVALEHVEATGGSGEYDWKQCFSILVYDGRFTVVDCTFTGLVVVYRTDSTSNPTVKITSATLNHGLEYTGIIDDVQNYYEVVKSLFADGSLLFTPDGTYIDVTDKSYWNIISDGVSVAFFEYDKAAVVKLHTHTVDEHGKCTVCGEQIYVAVLTMADGTTENCSSFREGWAAAIANEGSTLKLLCDVDLGSVALDAGSGRFTLDLGGFSLKGSVSYELILVSSSTADIIIKNGKLINTASVTSETLNFAFGMYIRSGKVTLDNVDVAGGFAGSDGKQQSYSIYIDGGELAVVGSNFTGAIYVRKQVLEADIKLKITSATLNDGIVYRGVINVGGEYEKYWQAVEAFFADGSVLLDPDGKYIDVTADDYWQVTSEAGSGEALFTYEAKSIVEQHAHTTNENGKCTTCDIQVYVAVLTKADGTTERVSTLEEGLTAAAANEGSTLALLCDVDLIGETDFRVSSGKFTFDLAGFSITGKSQYGVIWVSNTADITIRNGKLINICKDAVQDGGHAIIVYGGKLTLEGVDVTGSYGDAQCYSVEVSGGGKLTVLSGSFTGAIAVTMTSEIESTLKIISATLNNGIRFEYVNFSSTVITNDEVYEIVKSFIANGSVLLDANGKAIDITDGAYWKISGRQYAFEYTGAATVHAHTVSEWIIDTLPALFREGLRHGVCSDCREAVSEAIPAIDFDSAEVGHNCSFGRDLAMMYAIPMYYFDGCTDIRLVVTKENGNVARTLEYYVNDISGSLYYCFSYTGVAAKEMGDRLTAVLEFTRDGVEYSGIVDIYSLKAYAMERLENSPNPEFKKLLVSLLNYGAAAQTYFDYRTDALVNADLTDEQNALAAQTYAPFVTAENGDDNTNAAEYPSAITGKNVVFGNRITFLFATSFKEASELEGVALRIRYTNSAGSEVITSVDGSKFVYRTDVGCYTAYFDGLVASELRSTLELTLINKNGDAISEAITYSLDTYVQNRMAMSESESFKALLEATMIYADSANAYFSMMS